MSGFFVEIIDALFSSKSITLQEENETAKLYIGKWIHQNKVFLHCVKLARIILARHYVQSVRIRSSTDPYFLTTGKHGPEKLRIRTLFTQWQKIRILVYFTQWYILNYFSNFTNYLSTQMLSELIKVILISAF